MPGPEKILLLALLGSIGVCVGSFLNVVAYRLPRECMSLRKPGSRCPHCATPIPWHRNLPVLTYLVQLGRCACCDGRISPRYPLVELLCGALFLLTATRLVPEEGFAQPADHMLLWLAVAVGCLITAVLLALTLIDLDFRILPDEFTKSGIILGPFLAWLVPEFQPWPIVNAWPWFESWSPRNVALIHGAMGAVSGMGVLWLIGWLGAKAFRKPAMGLGDVKMLGAMGGVLGFWVFLALALAAIGGSVVGIALRIVLKIRYIPFGPFLAGGMFGVMLYGQDIVRYCEVLLRR